MLVTRHEDRYRGLPRGRTRQGSNPPPSSQEPPNPDSHRVVVETQQLRRISRHRPPLRTRITLTNAITRTGNESKGSFSQAAGTLRELPRQLQQDRLVAQNLESLRLGGVQDALNIPPCRQAPRELAVHRTRPFGTNKGALFTARTSSGHSRPRRSPEARPSMVTAQHNSSSSPSTLSTTTRSPRAKTGSKPSKRSLTPRNTAICPTFTATPPLTRHPRIAPLFLIVNKVDRVPYCYLHL